MPILLPLTAAVGGEQAVVSHDSEHSLLTCPDTINDPQPGPYLAMALALERGPFKVVLDEFQKLFIRPLRPGTALFARTGLCAATGIE
jgi:hypothetical protein